MSLKSFFQKIGNFFSNLFKGLEPELKKAVDFGVNTTNAIKKFDLDHPGTVDIISALIPGDKDNKVIATVREKLPDIMLELRLVDSTLGLTDPNEIVASAIKTLQQLSGDYRSTFLNSLSIILSQVAADGKLSWDDASVLIKWYYDHKDNPETDTTIEAVSDGKKDSDPVAPPSDETPSGTTAAASAVKADPDPVAPPSGETPSGTTAAASAVKGDSDPVAPPSDGTKK